MSKRLSAAEGGSRKAQALFAPRSSSSENRPPQGASGGGGSRFQACPCCEQMVHRLLMDAHLESQCPGPPPDRNSAAAPAATPAPPPSEPRSLESDPAVRVVCPLCNEAFRNEEMFAHVEQCRGVCGSRSGGGSSSSTDMGGPSGGGSSSSCSCSQHDGGGGVGWHLGAGPSAAGRGDVDAGQPSSQPCSQPGGSQLAEAEAAAADVMVHGGHFGRSRAFDGAEL